MHRPKQRWIEEFGIKPGGDPHIAKIETGTERVRRFILPAAIPIVAHPGDDIHTEIQLSLLGELLVQEGVVNLGAGGDRLDQLHLLRPQGVEDGLHIRGLHAGFVNYRAADHTHGHRA